MDLYEKELRHAFLSSDKYDPGKTALNIASVLLLQILCKYVLHIS